MKTDYLKIIFYKKLSKFSNDAAFINETFEELLKNYTARGRYYHDLTHIINLLKLYEEYKPSLNDTDVVFFSIWFHDAIFDTWKKGNEEKSADWAKSVLSKTNMPPSRIEKVVDCILATKSHETNGDSDMSFFLDFDMSILGSEETIYEIYTKQISDEYSFYPTFLYNRGRKKVLESFLEKEMIYKTGTFKALLEQSARANIQRELDSL
jgi:predicted metal-dependent HD superfamily phosphohydrolase